MDEEGDTKTPVAHSEADEDAEGPNTAAATAGLPISLGPRAPQQERQVIGPLGTTPYGAQGPRAERERSPRRDVDAPTAATEAPTAQAAAAETPQLTAAQLSTQRHDAADGLDGQDEQTPPLTAAQLAVLRGDSVGSYDSLPAVVEEELVQPPRPTTPVPASNARRGAPRT